MLYAHITTTSIPSCFGYFFLSFPPLCCITFSRPTNAHAQNTPFHKYPAYQLDPTISLRISFHPSYQFLLSFLSFLTFLPAIIPFIFTLLIPSNQSPTISFLPFMSSSTTPPHRAPKLSTNMSVQNTMTGKQTSQNNIGWDNQNDGFKAYMEQKNIKLRQQFQQQYISTNISDKSNNHLSTKQIFKHVVIWIDGYTKPSKLSLTKMMALHGGKVETYFSSTLVTHVIAQNLSTATRKKLLRNKNNIKVVTPNWIVDSINKATKLSTSNYQVKGMTDPTNTRLFACKKTITKKSK